MQSSRNHFPSLFSSIIFVLGALFAFGIGLIMGVTALASLIRGTEVQATQTILLIAFGFEGIILVAAAFFSIQKFLRKTSADQQVSISIADWQIAALTIVAGASILTGYQIGEMTTVNWIFLPIFTILAAAFPLAVFFAFGSRTLPLATRWQTWSSLGFGMSLTPLILFALETFVAILIFFVIIGYLVTQPQLLSELQEISQQIMLIGPESEEALELLAPFLTRPSVLVTALIYMAILVPVLEEIFKPLGVWLFARTLQFPAQGFTLGALSGGGYALIETLSVSGQTAEWASVLFSRIGTGLLHITTSALMGAAIVLAWHERRYLRLLGTYGLAVLLHGLWNTLAILFTFSSLADLVSQSGYLRTIQQPMIIAMVILAMGLFALLLLANRKMRSLVAPQSREPVVPAENIKAD